MRRRVSYRKQNNQGSAMITVIVVIIFVSILATTLIYISGLNYRMKVADYNTKVSFYEAEVPMEEIRTQLVIDASDAFVSAYRTAASEFVGTDSAMREEKFQKAFCQKFLEIWNMRDGDGTNGISTELAIKNIISNYDQFTVTVETGFKTGFSDPGTPHNIIKLEGVEIQYTNSSNNYTSIIKTDFWISIPNLNWGVDSYSNIWEENATNSGDNINFQQLVIYKNWTKK